ncbi:MAG: response regulator transcription factor [Candidatus Binatia bacterium]
MPIRILIADDHIMFADMLQTTLANQQGRYAVVGVASDGEMTLALTASLHPDLLLLDYEMPKLGRLASCCQEVLRLSPTTKILVVGSHTEETYAIEAAVGGAHGYISKAASLADLCTALVTIHAGGIWADPHLPPRVFHTFLHCKGDAAQELKELSRQELTILSLLAQGLSNQQISTRLHISPKTVKNHLTHIFAKLRTSNRHQAAQRFFVTEGEKRHPVDVLPLS